MAHEKPHFDVNGVCVCNCDDCWDFSVFEESNWVVCKCPECSMTDCTLHETPVQ